MWIRYCQTKRNNFKNNNPEKKNVEHFEFHIKLLNFVYFLYQFFNFIFKLTSQTLAEILLNISHMKQKYGDYWSK